MEEGDDVLKHLNTIKTLAEQLDALGAPLGEEDLVITLFASLSESYRFLITVLESRADSLLWELVTSRLMHEDLKRKEQGVEGAVRIQGQAFVVQDTGRRTRRQAPAKTDSACHYCGENGHWIAKCPFGFARTRNDNGRSVPTSRKASRIKATTCCWLDRSHAPLCQDACGWFTRVRRST